MNEKSNINNYEALQGTVKFFENLIYILTDGVVVTDTTQNIILANEAFCNLFDKNRSEMIETNLLVWLEQLDTDTVRKWTVLENEVFKNGFCHNIELQRVRPPGNKMYFNVSASRMKHTAFNDSNVTVSIWHDITERVRLNKRMEELNESLERRVSERTAELTGLYEKLQNEIIERKKIEETLIQSEKLKSIGTVASGISHEINNILAIIMGRAEILQRGFKDDSKLKEGLSSIIKASNAGADIVKKMLVFAKSDAKASDYVFIDISSLIWQAIDFKKPRWKNMAQSKNINYHIDTAEIDEMLEVFCNPTEMTEVFINIIKNALDAMPDGGCIAFSVKSDKNTAFISISDTGAGISEDIKRKIFDPFFTTRSPQGTGLGMSIVYSIIKRHNGKIEVESEIGKGTTFNISIPIHQEMEQNIVSPSKPSSDKITKKLRILVVDDEKDICKVLESFLTSDGHIVKTVNSGAEAIELIRKEQFDLVLSDLAMPGKTGYDVITVLNELETRPKIGIITGWSEKINSLVKEPFKVDFVIIKPLHLSEIERHINAAFMTM